MWTNADHVFGWIYIIQALNNQLRRVLLGLLLLLPNRLHSVDLANQLNNLHRPVGFSVSIMAGFLVMFLCC